MKAILITSMMILGSSSAFAYRSINECQVTRDVGAAYTSHRGFAQEIRRLRGQCARMQRHNEAAEVVWAGSGTYVCRVGNFCNSGGN